MLQRSLVCSLVVVAVTCGSAPAQDSTHAWLRVESNLPASLVLVDSLYVGRADRSLIRVPANSARIVLVPTEVGAWDLPQPNKDLSVAAGDTATMVMDFAYQYRIDSSPFGALVSVPAEGGLVLGKTPLVYSTATPLLSTLLLERSGYANAQIQPGTDVINRHSVALRLLDQDVPDDLAVEWAPRSANNKWITWAAAGLALTGGALAVNFKFKADDEYDRYLETGDPAIKEHVDRYDTYSYVALGAMQVGIGLLAFRLAF